MPLQPPKKRARRGGKDLIAGVALCAMGLS